MNKLFNFEKLENTLVCLSIINEYCFYEAYKSLTNLQAISINTKEEGEKKLNNHYE